MYKYEYNHDSKQFDIIEIHSDLKVATASNIHKAKLKIKTLEDRGFQGCTPRFMFNTVQIPA